MNRKFQMAEWILDFFRRSNSKANEIIMFPTIMNAVGKLNPKEKDLFTNVANELISHGYITFEQKPVQCIRLTVKGEDYIYNPDTTLDCCQEERKPTEALFRDIISLGQLVSTLQTYQDILQRGELAESLQMLDNPFGNHRQMRQLRIETIKEYYGYLYRFFYSACLFLVQLDDKTLRSVIFSYVETVSGILKIETAIQRAPMIPKLQDAYVKTQETLKNENEQQIIRVLKDLLFT